MDKAEKYHKIVQKLNHKCFDDFWLMKKELINHLNLDKKENSNEEKLNYLMDFIILLIKKEI